jgi:hypothetical protein
MPGKLRIKVSTSARPVARWRASRAARGQAEGRGGGEDEVEAWGARKKNLAVTSRSGLVEVRSS